MVRDRGRRDSGHHPRWTLADWFHNDSAMNDPDCRLIEAEGADALEAAREILREYADTLHDKLCVGDFEIELARLPGDYGPPTGVLLLALVDGAVAGCGAIRPLPDCDYANACEMKRLYVRRPFRQLGLGRSLAQALLDRARHAGYSVLLLDTLDDMEAARGLYASLGFEEIPPYYFNPIPGAHYLKADLCEFQSSY